MLNLSTSKTKAAAFKFCFILSLMILGSHGYAQIGCPLQDVSFSPDNIVVCDSTTTLDIESSILNDTTPIFLKTESSFPNFRFWFTREFDTENNGCTYVLKISGSYTVWSNWWWFDALYTFDTPGSDIKTSDDAPIGLTISPADYILPASYNPQHEYYFYYTGDGSTKSVRFFDLGQLSDNEGNLTFDWYVIPCYETEWSVDNQVVSTEEDLQTPVSGYGEHSIDLLVSDKLSNCSLSYSGSLFLVEPPNVQLDIQPSCHGGNNAVVFATVTNSIQAQYQWSNSPTIANFLTDQGPGNYSLIVQDSFGCTTTTDYNIASIPAIQLDVLTSPSCPDENNGQAEILIQSGDAPFQYYWNNSSSDSSIVTDFFAGNYDVTVYDIHGCENIFPFSIDAYPSIQFNLEASASCIYKATGAIDVEMLSGDSPFNYDWDGNAFNTSNPNNLNTGTYAVTVTDSHACQKVDSVFVDQFPNLEHTIDVNPACTNEANGSLNVLISSGSPPYRYFWSNNNVGQTNDQLSAGEYKVTIEDGNDCPFYDSIALDNFPVPFLTEVIKASCPNEATGAYQAQIQSGEAPFLFNWNTGATDSAQIEDLVSGTYTYTLTDGYQCEHYYSFEIEEKPVLNPPLLISDVSCFGSSDGQLIIDTSGIEAVFGLENESFQQPPQFNALSSGTYSVYIQDDEGCIFEDTFVVESPDELILIPSSNTTILVGASTPIHVEAIGGNQAYTYEWSPVVNLSCSDCPDPIASPIESTVYTVIVRDQAGCSSIAQIRINVDVIESREVFVPSAFSPNNDGLNDYLTIFSDQNVSSIQKFLVFDRWGNVIFSKQNFPSNEVEQGWDGTFNNKEIQDGVYVWRSEIIWRDGKITFHSGESTLLR